MTYRTSSNRWSHNNGTCFLRMDYNGLSGDFQSILTQVAIHLSALNHLGTVLTSIWLCEPGVKAR